MNGFTTCSVKPETLKYLRILKDRLDYSSIDKMLWDLVLLIRKFNLTQLEIKTLIAYGKIPKEWTVRETKEAKEGEELYEGEDLNMPTSKDFTENVEETFKIEGKFRRWKDSEVIEPEESEENE